MTIPSTPAPRSRRAGEAYPALLTRLCELSVRHYHDPYVDIAWDAAEHRLNPDDPRHCIAPTAPLAQTAWYAALDPRVRAQFGHEWTVQLLKYGIGMEAVLSRGALQFCQTLPNGSLEARYAMHTVVEEGRHTLMFQEYIDRSGVSALPVSGIWARFDDHIAHLGRTFPELFYFAVLSGELFIDRQNRELLRRPRESVHPLLRTIIRIHVIEEARHQCFAEHCLRQRLPRTTRLARERMAWVLPQLCAGAVQLMLVPDRRLRRKFGIPRAALRQAFGRGSEHRRAAARSCEPILRLCAENGMLERRHRRWWRASGFDLDGVEI
jgi:hypothetical protein